MANIPSSPNDPVTGIYILLNWSPTAVDGCQLYYDVTNGALHISDLTGNMSTFGSISLNYQPEAELVLGSSLTDPNACRILYQRGTSPANHTLPWYAGEFTAASLIGDPPTCVLDIGHS